MAAQTVLPSREVTIRRIGRIGFGMYTHEEVRSARSVRACCAADTAANAHAAALHRQTASLTLHPSPPCGVRLERAVKTVSVAGCACRLCKSA